MCFNCKNPSCFNGSLCNNWNRPNWNPPYTQPGVTLPFGRDCGASQRPCNPCGVLGCLFPSTTDCVTTTKAYPCLGIILGANLTIALAAVETLCANTNPIAWASFNYFCLSGAPYTTAQTFVQGISNFVCNLSASVTTLTTNINTINSEISTINSSLTTIEGNITSINSSITTINNNVAALGDETWKNIGAGGNMANGQPVPAYATGFVSGGFLNTPGCQIRKSGTKLDIRGIIQVDTFGAGTGTKTIFVLPIGYRSAIDTSILLLLASGITANGILLSTGEMQVVAPGGGFTAGDGITVPEQLLSLD